MINSIFGHKIDIHGGGFDLKFPHHENEIAQAKAHDGSKLANIWMHNGFVNFDGEKMSMSLGNVVLAKDAINQFGGPVMRLLMLSTHYRAPVSFTNDTVNGAKNEYEKIKKTYAMLAVAIQMGSGDVINGGNLDKNVSPFLNELANDLNTSNALACVFEMVKQANLALRKSPVDIKELETIFFTLKDMFMVLGLEVPFTLLSEDDKDLYNKYLTLKREKKFTESDELRNVLISRGIL